MNNALRNRMDGRNRSHSRTIGHSIRPTTMTPRRKDAGTDRCALECTASTNAPDPQRRNLPVYASPFGIGELPARMRATETMTHLVPSSV